MSLSNSIIRYKSNSLRSAMSVQITRNHAAGFEATARAQDRKIIREVAEWYPVQNPELNARVRSLLGFAPWSSKPL